MIVTAISYDVQVTMCDQREEAVTTAKEINELIASRAPILVEGPDQPWIECVVSCSVCDIGYPRK